MVYRLLDDPGTAAGVPGLEVVSYGDSPVLPSRLREAVTRWGGRWQQGYGMNEAAVICRLTPADHEAAVADRPELLASVGRPVAGVEVEVRDGGGAAVGAGRTGEVWMRSAAMMAGYWGRPGLTASVLRDGWLRTGDLGHLGEDGYLYLDDRVKDVVMVDGDNVYCVPVEAALARHPAVAEAVVVGRRQRSDGRGGLRVPGGGARVRARRRDGGRGLRPGRAGAVSGAPADHGVLGGRDPADRPGKPDKRRLRDRAAGEGR